MADDDAVTRRLEQSFGAAASAGADTAGGAVMASGVLPAGARVGRFLIVRLVGEGGLGRVYLAFDPELDRKVAIKLLKLRALTAEDASEGRDALLREAQTMARLAHPNVVTIYDVGVHEGDVFLAMEYVLGDSMRAWLAKAPRRWPDVLRVFLAAGRGLAAAHAAGIVHRDFKPDNVIVDPDGRARVLDFGLALARDDSPGGALEGEPAVDATTRRRFVGTPAYMAPEQLMCRPTDARGDQFSFCVALYEAACGVRPFAGRKVSEVLFAIHGAQLQAPTRAGAPGWLRPVLQRGLASDPGDRFPDMEALLAELARDRWAPVRLAARVLGGALALAGLGLAIHTWRLPGDLRVAVTDVDGAPLGGVVHVGEQVLAADEGGAAGPVPPGRYELTVSAPDHIAEHRVVEVLRGARVDLQVALRHEEGTFDLEVQPAGGTVLIDGEDFGSRLRRLPVATGDHDVLARRLGHHDARLRWPLRAGERRSGFVYLPQAVAWSRAATGINDMPQTLGDVDGDGQLEILHSNFGTLTATDPRRDRNVWRLVLPGRASEVASTGDLDGDGIRDVAALMRRADGTTTLQTWSGARPPAATDVTEPRSMWHTEAPTRLASGDTGVPPIVVDLDSDGADDVVAPLFPDGDLSAWHGRTGAPLWRWPTPAPLHNVVAGAGPDGPRLFVATRGGLHRVDGRSGAAQWTRGLDGDLERALQEQTRGAPARVPTLIARPLDDVAGDDLLVLLGGVADHYLLALAGADGRLLWRRDAGGLKLDLWPGVDVTGDGVVDLPISTERVHVAGTRHIELLDGASGRALWRVPTDGGGQLGALAWPGSPAVVHEGRTAGLRLRAASDGALLHDLELDSDPSVPPVLTDWDSDGADDLVLATRRGTVIAFDRDGEIAGSALVRRPVSRLGPAGDVNGDGFPDLLVLGVGPSLLRGSAVLWQREGEDAVRARPLVADLDADGRPELVAVGDFGGEGRSLHVFDAATGAERFAARVSDAIREPTLVPVGVGGLDILIQDADGLLLVDGRTGRVGERVNTALSYATPLVADLDADGRLEVVSLPWYVKDPLTLFGLGDRVPRHRRPPPGDGGWARPLAADLDGDGRDELLVVTHQGTLAVIDADLGQVRGTFELGGRVVHPPWVGDLDGDGALEVISGSAAGELVCLRGARLTPLWGLLGLGALNSQPAVDVHNATIFTASATEGAVAVRPDGTIAWRHRPEPGAALQPEPAAPFVLADLEHDGAPELLAAFADGSLRVLDAATGAPQWQFRSAGGTIEAAPTPADVDGDGVDEVVVGSHDRHLYVLRTPHRAAP